MIYKLRNYKIIIIIIILLKLINKLNIFLIFNLLKYLIDKV